jgi:ABC-2 type transport system ATP-binding protein
MNTSLYASQTATGLASPANQAIVFEEVSKYYGEVLGVSHVNLSVPPGITSLVGPNGSGKTTLMNLLTGLIRPTRGQVSVLGLSPRRPEEFFRQVGYCTQFDSFPRGFTGYEFISAYLALAGFPPVEVNHMATKALDRAGLLDAAHRKIAGYSKGMRQRIKLAQAMAHSPRVLVLDEPLNGLDPLARAETLALFRAFAEQGRFLMISTQVLHEVDLVADHVILLSQGTVVAEGKIHEVRSEIRDQPLQILIHCDRPRALASRLFESGDVVEARLHPDGGSILVKTRDADRFYLQLNHIALDSIEIESVAPADDDVISVYDYLIDAENTGS